MRSSVFLNRYLYVVYLLISIITGAALLKYNGQSYIYLLFTLIMNFALFSGFRKGAIFFDAFIGAFFWLGFWLKLTVRLVFLDGQFSESVGNFSGEGEAYDRVLLVVSCGVFGLIIASYLRERFIFKYPDEIETVGNAGIFEFYKKNRMIVLVLFVTLFSGVAVSNLYFGIYQRGEIAQTILPFGLSGVYKWLLLFGLASFTAIILRFEFFINKSTTYLVVIIGMLESFLSSVSLFSRGMILNTSALVYGVMRSLKTYKTNSSIKFLIVSFVIFIAFFVSSIFLVTQFRTNNELAMYQVTNNQISSLALSEEVSRNLIVTGRNVKMLFLDRWVGIEGVMAISSYPKQGWELFFRALSENYSENESGFYDVIINSSYLNIDKSKYHYQSLPGMIAFLFYSGSYLFLFFSMVVLGFIAVFIEILTFKMGGKNLILCALIAQVVAYRYSHFGYVPKQSYLLFGAIFLNLFLVYMTNKWLCYFYKNKKSYI